MKAGKPLGEYVSRKLFYGLKTGLNEAFEISAAEKAVLTRSAARNKKLIKPCLGGQDIRRYLVKSQDRYLIVIPSGWTREQMLSSC
jgi:hypothetical protein